MKQKRPSERPHAQKKYRQSQSNKGLVRFEIQVSADTKARFDELVEAVADELPTPWDVRRRTAKARAQVFDEITRGVIHEFFMLKDELGAKDEEIKVLSPSFFKSTYPDDIPLPQAITALPDDPKHLKKLLAERYQDAQQSKLMALEYKRRAEQFEELYRVSSDYNEKLQIQLEEKQ